MHNRIKLAVAGLAILSLSVAGAAFGQASDNGSYVDSSSVDVVYQPAPQNYRPDGNLDGADGGKAIAIDCTISDSGRLSDCYAEANDINDQNFVRAALNNAQQWVVAQTLRDGEPSAGKAFHIGCRFELVGEVAAPAVAVASDSR